MRARATRGGTKRSRLLYTHNCDAKLLAARYGHKETALEIAETYGRTEPAEALLRLRPYPWVPDGEGLLCYAAKHGRTELAAALLAAGADVNAKDKGWAGNTALILAATHGRTETVAVLAILAAGAEE